MTAEPVTRLPNQVQRLERAAIKAYKEHTIADAARHEAKALAGRKPSLANNQALALAELTHRRAREAWRKAEDALAEARAGGAQ